jgi:hypothetical protein
MEKKKGDLKQVGGGGGVGEGRRGEQVMDVKKGD